MIALNEPVPQSRGFKRVLNQLDMTLFTVCAILVIDTLAASAKVGVSSLAWWIITFVFFFVPYGLIVAELGAAYPGEGGIQQWIRRAYGDKWAGRTVWYYWVNVALWMPSVYILFAGMFAQLFAPEMSLWVKIALGVLMTWITVGVGIASLANSKWVPNIGAVVKAAIMLIMGVAGIWIASTRGFANEMTLSTLTPGWDVGLAFLPVVVYNFLGFELMSGAGEEMENPARDVPIAIVVAGLAIVGFYLLATFGILVALPVNEIGLISGVIDTVARLLGESQLAKTATVLIGIGALYTFFANMVTWTLGANRTAQAAAADGELPAVFASLHPTYQTPVGAFLWTGIVSTVVIVLYGFMAANAEDLFWSLFAFSSIVFLLPYLLVFPAFLRLRRIDAGTSRPYRVPGGMGALTLIATICVLFILQAILFFVWVPGEPVDWSTAGPILGGVVLTVLVGEVILALQTRRKGA